MSESMTKAQAALADCVESKFGKLTVISVKGNTINSAMALCKCECGNIKAVNYSRLIYGKTKSCGCLQRGILRKHGQSRTRLYRIWNSMICRCNSKSASNYCRYGGRGITVCNEWLSFEPFWKWAIKNGYSDFLTIDRIDNDGNYSPENCRWADDETQRNNQRKTHRLTFNGKTQSMAQWSRETRLPYSTLDGRINKLNWPAELALTAEKGTKRCSIKL